MKATLIIASILLVAGLILGVVGLTLNGFDFEEMNTMKRIQNTYVIEDTFSHIAIEASIAKIEIVPATDGVCRVDCEEKDKLYFTVSVSGDTLCIDLVNDAKWYDFIGVNAGNVSATVYLPEQAYASLRVNNSTGNTTVQSGITFESATVENTTGAFRFSGNVTNALSAKVSTGSLALTNATVGGNLTLESSTGSIQISNVSVGGKISLETATGSAKMSTVTCDTLTLVYKTGSTTLTDVTVNGHAEIKGTTGSLRFERLAAATVKAEASTGSIKGTLAHEMIVFAHSSTGSVDTPRGTQGGTCEFETSTGGIEIAFS